MTNRSKLLPIGSPLEDQAEASSVKSGAIGAEGSDATDYLFLNPNPAYPNYEDCQLIG